MCESETGGAFTVFSVDSGGSRFSTQRSNESRRVVADLHEAARDVQEDQQQPDARREQRHEVVVGPERGQPDDPQRADDRAREAPEPTDHRDRHDQQRILDEEVALARAEREVHRAEEDATEARDEPRERERGQLGARGGHGHRGRREFVLAHADDHAPDPCTAEMADEQQHHDEHEQHEVVVRAVLVREFERPDVGARDLDGRSPGREERTVEQVDLRRDRERERADGEQQAAYAERADADEHRDEARTDRAEEERPRERDGRERTVDDAGVVPADVRGHAARQGRRGQRAEARERHLPE